MEGLRDRLAAVDPLAVLSRCDAGVPMPTPFSPGGAGPIPRMELDEPSPVPMPNPCDGGAVAVRAGPEVVTPYRFGPPPVPPPGGARRFSPQGLPIPPRFFPLAAPPPDEQ